MVAAVEVELDWRGKRYTSVERGLEAVAGDIGGDVDKSGPLVRKLLQRYMSGVVKSVADRMNTPWPAGTSPAGQFPGTLSRRSGKLVSQFTDANIIVKGGSALSDTSVSFNLPGIAAVHERGATIRPKKAQYLTIPLPPALDSRGVPILPRARDWQDTFIIRSKKGNLLIVRKKGDGIEPLYVLKKSVVIPKRLGFEEAFDSGLDLLADTIAQEVIREFFNG